MITEGTFVVLFVLIGIVTGGDGRSDQKEQHMRIVTGLDRSIRSHSNRSHFIANNRSWTLNH
jgi:hypothetical protein